MRKAAAATRATRPWPGRIRGCPLEPIGRQDPRRQQQQHGQGFQSSPAQGQQGSAVASPPAARPSSKAGPWPRLISRIRRDVAVWLWNGVETQRVLAAGLQEPAAPAANPPAPAEPPAGHRSPGQQTPPLLFGFPIAGQCSSNQPSTTAAPGQGQIHRPIAPLVARRPQPHRSLPPVGHRWDRAQAAAFLQPPTPAQLAGGRASPR